ncbi:MAG: hemolysin activation protein [Bacteroidaceae bacterium]|nr:hemolysin activation protein [Bacteroidaceae bacterium]
MTDVSVLILFFNRPAFLSRLFEEVRKAAPPHLFLYQDGPRDVNDLAGIEACRKIVENVDWPCEVHRFYQEKNYGCDPSNFISQKWAFSYVDKCIVFEDDDIPTQSFFVFCKEMLDRYEHDERIGMIAGFNPDEHTPDIAESYFFTSNFSIWGWASWRRVIDQWEEDYGFLDRPQAVAQLEALTRERKLRKDFLPMCRAHRNTGKAFYETIFHASLLLHSQLAIVPVHNQISNIGVTNDSTHFSGSVHALPRGYRRIFTMGRHELSFPLSHPDYIVDHIPYRKRVYRIMAWRHPFVKIFRSVEELFLNLRHGEWKRIASAMMLRVKKLCGHSDWH